MIIGMMGRTDGALWLDVPRPSLFPGPSLSPSTFFFSAFPADYSYPTQIQSSTNLVDWQAFTNLAPGFIQMSVPSSRAKPVSSERSSSCRRLPV